jgi:hypothetical protein
VSHAVIEAVAIFGAGLAAGTINTVVGSGTLITFPTLLGFGFPPVLANVSNNVGLVPGVLSGIYGYRKELAGQRARVLRLGLASLLGGLVGAILLLVLPQSAFKAIVPALIAVALVMVICQPWLARQVAARQRERAGPAEQAASGLQLGGPVVWVLVFLMGIYGGYFGAAQGILLLGLFGITFRDSLQRINAVKNVLACLVNGIAAVIFIIATNIDWTAAGLIAAGSVIGGQIGARVGRRLPPWGLRILIVCVGVAALVRLLALPDSSRHNSGPGLPGRQWRVTPLLARPPRPTLASHTTAGPASPANTGESHQARQPLLPTLASHTRHDSLSCSLVERSCRLRPRSGPKYDMIAQVVALLMREGPAPLQWFSERAACCVISDVSGAECVY